LRLEHDVIGQDLGQLILTLFVDATGVAGDHMPEVLSSLYEGLLPFKGRQACFKIHKFVPHIWMYASALSCDLR
jgi:hypothetical protein